jgi:hypothetical protein
MNINIHEILEQVQDADSWEDKIRILRQYDTPALRFVLYFAFKPELEFFLDTIPLSYKANNCPIGMGETSIAMEMTRFHYFLKQGSTPYKKKVLMLLGMLEALEEREANVVINMIMKDMSEYGLRLAHVKEAFPNIGL